MEPATPTSEVSWELNEENVWGKKKEKLVECLECVKCSINVGVFPSFLENSCLEEVGRKVDCEDSRCLLGKVRTPEPGAVQEPCGAGRETRRCGQWGKPGRGCSGGQAFS